ncbi:MAG: hypothetical protein IT332_08050 [Ardenticatenales bacterium]|nr:hypothetical protein [Ardenticatenales bacterium]
MSTLFDAICAFGPRLIHGRTVELEDLVPMLSKRSGLSALDADANRGRIGLDDAGYKSLWDVAHPEDPVVLPVGRSSRAA